MTSSKDYVGYRALYTGGFLLRFGTCRTNAGDVGLVPNVKRGLGTRFHSSFQRQNIFLRTLSLDYTEPDDDDDSQGLAAEAGGDLRWEIGGQPDLQEEEEENNLVSRDPENAYEDGQDSRQDDNGWRNWHVDDLRARHFR